jgi:lipoprotein NlpI
MGDFAKASADFAAVSTAKPDYQYPVLWFAIVQSRIGNAASAAIAHDAAALNLSEWPGPIVKLYLGQSTPNAALTAAAQGDARDMAGRECEADFYVGEWQLTQHNVDVAKNLLQNAVGKCPGDFIEQSAAKIEIARLK